MLKSLKSLTQKEFLRYFGTDLQCTEFLENLKWQSGFCCHNCGNHKYCQGSKEKDRQCTRCRKIHSVTSGTLFHKCKIPIHLAFYMTYLIVTDKKGCASTLLAERTGLQQKTCWLFRMKVFKAMESTDRHSLEGEVDILCFTVDKLKNAKVGERKKIKEKVVLGVEEKGGGAARIYCKSMPYKYNTNIRNFINNKINSEAHIKMDKKVLAVYFSKNRDIMENINLRITNRVVDSIQKRIYGRYGYVIHLSAYLSETCYRHNRHRMKAEIFEDIITRMMKHEPSPYKALIYS
ncbi:MAG: transposase [Saprospiraceae bacterium]|nr:transposase [Saprospiraceae bacterium]